MLVDIKALQYSVLGAYLALPLFQLLAVFRGKLFILHAIGMRSCGRWCMLSCMQLQVGFYGTPGCLHQTAATTASADLPSAASRDDGSCMLVSLAVSNHAPLEWSACLPEFSGIGHEAACSGQPACNTV